MSGCSATNSCVSACRSPDCAASKRSSDTRAKAVTPSVARARRWRRQGNSRTRGCSDAGHRRVRLLPCLRHRWARATEGVTALAHVSDDLLVAAQSGDRHALTQLLVALQPDIRRYARRLCHRTSVIEDVVQEALIVVYRRVGTIRSPAALAGWLLTVIARLCMLPALMLMRGVEELSSLEESRELAKVPPDELRIDLVNAIESLSPSHREVLLLRDLEDLTIGEIARRLGVTREAAKSRLRRARTLVREYLLGTKDSGREST